ncbi:MAG TPA: polysaccharide biosynthesis tyrosine autokinase [Gammaproteobacteria bacterium]|nr:polysaccharide biosynthesis tyrosine autokinase [Gammaproteobacteria bacterium]
MSTERFEQVLRKATAVDREESAAKPAQQRTKAARRAAPKGQQQRRRTQIVYTQTKRVKVSPEVLRRNRLIAGSPNAPWANAYKILRARVLQKLREGGNLNTLGVTSATPGAGKSLTASNLALSMAMEVNKTVLLVDADLRRPVVHTYFGFEPKYGLSDYLTRGVPIEEMLVNPGIGRFVILPAGRPIENASEMLSSPRMGELVEELKSRYRSRYVIFDLPPMLVVDDVLSFAPYIDASLLVVEEGKSKQEDVTHCAELLSDMNMIGTVLNKSTETSTSYYSYYSY